MTEKQLQELADKIGDSEHGLCGFCGTVNKVFLETEDANAVLYGRIPILTYADMMETDFLSRRIIPLFKNLASKLKPFVIEDFMEHPDTVKSIVRAVAKLRADDFHELLLQERKARCSYNMELRWYAEMLPRIPMGYVDALVEEDASLYGYIDVLKRDAVERCCDIRTHAIERFDVDIEFSDVLYYIVKRENPRARPVG